MLPEFCDQREHRVVQDMARDVVMSLLLIPDVNQAVVNPHLELCRRFKLATLVLIEFLQTLEGYGKMFESSRARISIRTHYSSGAGPLGP